MIFSGENRTSDHVKTLFLLFNDIRPFSGENRTSEDVKISFLFSSLTFSGENRTSEDVKTSFLCSSLTFSGENRTSEDVKTSFLCSSLTFSGENRTSEDLFFLLFTNIFRKNRTSEDVQNFFLLFSGIFRGNTDCRLARGKIWPLILADFGTRTEKDCPFLSLDKLANSNLIFCCFAVAQKILLKLENI